MNAGTREAMMLNTELGAGPYRAPVVSAEVAPKPSRRRGEVVRGR